MRRASPSILWLRQDLRLADNPALNAAAEGPFIAVYIWDESDPWCPGGAARWWLHKSLLSLKESFEDQGVSLLLRRGDPLKVLKDLVKETSASAIYWNRCYEPFVIDRDKKIKAFFKSKNLKCESYNGTLLIEPWELQTQSGKPYQVFTPFWRSLLEKSVSKPVPMPHMEGWKGDAFSESLKDWHLLPTLWGQGFEDQWKPGEKGATENLEVFLREGIETYSQNRDYPFIRGTSQLSPHLHWGELSCRQIWHRILQTKGRDGIPFLRQLGWREFSSHLLFHFPHLPERPLRSTFDKFPWENNPHHLKAWQEGMTGYPLVDAGMRQLWTTGWMHNRVRMVVASFLVKDLLIPWQSGEAWFWDTLVDADLANNAISWQWVAGCGADAAPYFRVFNPISQSQKFDPKGAYIKTWVPELRHLDTPYIHTPWLAPMEILRKAGIQLGETYPQPIVDHHLVRLRALSAYQLMKQENS